MTRLLPILLLLASGCAGRALMPTPNLYAAGIAAPFETLAPELRTSDADLLYVTDRAPERDGAGRLAYGAERSLSAAFGSVIVRLGGDLPWESLAEASRGADRDRELPLGLGPIEERGRFPATPLRTVDRNGRPEDDPDERAADRRTVAALRADLDTRLARTPAKRALIYVHGYNVTFEEAAFDLAELWHFTGREGVPILYTWPAGGGGAAGYGYDRESGQFTLFHLKHLLRALASFPEIEEFRILAHSRGADVTTSALRELFIETRAAGGDPRRRFRISELVLAAPDLDGQVFSQRVVAEKLTAGVGQTTVYTSGDDLAIGIAELLFGGFIRLGGATAERLSPELAEWLARLGNVHFVELRGETKGLGHMYFLDSPAASSDVILVLRHGRRPGAENGRPLTPAGPGLWVVTDDYLVPVRSD